MRRANRLNTSPSRCENPAGPSGIGSTIFRSVPTRGTCEASDARQHWPLSLREPHRTVRIWPPIFPVGADKGDGDETRDSNPAVPIPRPLSEAPRVRCGAFGDGERGGRRRPGRIPGARRTRRRRCSRGAWMASPMPSSNSGATWTPWASVSAGSSGIRSGALQQRVDDKAVKRGEVCTGPFYRRSAQQIRAGGTFTGQVFPARPASRRCPPNPTPGGRDEGGRS